MSKKSKHNMTKSLIKIKTKIAMKFIESNSKNMSSRYINKSQENFLKAINVFSVFLVLFSVSLNMYFRNQNENLGRKINHLSKEINTSNQAFQNINKEKS